MAHGRRYHSRPHRKGSALLAALSLAIFVIGCGEGSSLIQRTPGAAATTSPLILQPLMVTACLDRTPSFSRSYFDAGKNLLADALVQRAGVSGQQGATIYVTLIGHNSYATSATVRTIAVPAATSPGPTATPDTNTFDQATVTAAVATASAAAVASTNLVTQRIQPDVAFLRALNPATDSPTDIMGCISRASERFAAAPAGTEKLLLMVTDLQQAGPQQDGKTRPLAGVHVKVIEWQCDDVQTCDSLKSQWHEELVTKDQASSVAYYDPSETQAQVAGHLFDVSA